MDWKGITISCAGILLAGFAATGYIGLYKERQEVERQKSQIATLERQVMRATVDRSVSSQMEEIANEQREISDEQREEALQQTKIANEMRIKSEHERQNALVAEQNALASEKKAREASAVAESQREMADHQRLLAEFAKRTADTLSYIALARSLGSLSTIQYQAGNREADLLSYAAYLYTSRYHGDVYYPAVFQSMTRSSQSVNSWAENTGAVTNIEFMKDGSNKFVSVSNYGEILLCERTGSQLHTTPLLKNSQFDFRDVIIAASTKTIYAVSRTGYLIVINSSSKSPKVIPLDEIEHPKKLLEINENTLLIVGDKNIGLFRTNRETLSNVKQLPFQIVCASRKNSKPLLFDNQAQMHLVTGLDNMTTEPIPVKGTVTAYCESKNTGVEAYGMNDGTIYLKNGRGNIQKLVGHRSRITKMKLNGRRLYSASYDGSVKLWVTDNEKVEPITLLQINQWIMHFNFDSTKNTFWMGDSRGNLTAVNISIPLMVESMKSRLKRNLTTEEWNYFIGQNIPYETFVNANGKGGAK